VSRVGGQAQFKAACLEHVLFKAQEDVRGPGGGSERKEWAGDKERQPARVPRRRLQHASLLRAAPLTPPPPPPPPHPPTPAKVMPVHAMRMLPGSDRITSDIRALVSRGGRAAV
jgi:hypothetical protein